MELKLMNRTFTVKEKKLDENVDGEISYRLAEIHLDPELHVEDRVTTLFHEITHGILMETGMHFSFSHKQREMICEMIGSGMSRLISNNPNLFDDIKKFKEGEK